MQLSKLQGKRSLGLSALLAQRNSDTRPVGLLQSTGDDPNSDSKLSHSDDQNHSAEQMSAPGAVSEFDVHQELFMLQLAEEQPISEFALASSTGIANWKLRCDQSSGVAAWTSNESVIVSRVECGSGFKSNDAENGQILTSSLGDVNIFHQNSRDINSIFVEKQKQIIVLLNAATASLKLQLQSMQQERDDCVLEVSTLNVAIEEQKHEQQTQLLSFSLKLLQDESEMRKYQDKIHGMRAEINL
jgi:hypothetical protein